MAKSKQNRSLQPKRQGVETQASSSRGMPSDLETSVSQADPTKLQQHVLHTFRDACAEPLGTELEPVLQAVKGHLYDRNFLAAFGAEENLWAYAARWSPSRALAYLQIFQDIAPFVTESGHHLDDARTTVADAATTSDSGVLSGILEDIDSRIPRAAASNDRDSDNDSDTSSVVEIVREDCVDGKPPAYAEHHQAPEYENPPAYPANSAPSSSQGYTSRPALNLACLGGGAGAELVACAAWLRLQSDQDAAEDDPLAGEAPVDLNSVEIHCIDIAKWSSVIDKLEATITTPPVISKYASAAVKAANTALLPAGAMKIESVQQDLLDANIDCLRSIFQSSDIVTIMFTLNELYSTSVSKTQRLLFELTVATRPGTLLLVVDSPGSYSTVTINGAEKKYPMQWLLDHTLLEASKKTRILPKGDHWEKLVSDESRWFRLPKDLQYPIELENMRYQIHLYRRMNVDPESPQRAPRG